jgi:hypothetical protein
MNNTGIFCSKLMSRGAVYITVIEKSFRVHRDHE